MQNKHSSGSHRHGNNNKPGQSKKKKQGTQQFQQSLISQLRAFSAGLSPMEELGLKYNASDADDIAQLRQILSKKLTYPSSEVAETHLRANRLGQHDLHQDRNAFNPESLINDNSRFCPCCGCIEQQETLTLTQNLKHVEHIGISTYLFFLTIKNIILLLTTMFFVFSCYALITNKTASNLYRSNSSGQDIENSNLTFQGFLAFSLGSKQVYQTTFGVRTFFIQCWLGVAMVSIWAFIFVYIKYRERQAQYDVDYDSKTASDYSLLFENFPKGMKAEDLQKQLRQYQQNMKQYYPSHLITDPIRVAKINEATPFYLDYSSFDDEQVKKIEKEYQQCKKKIVQLIEQREESDKFSMSLQQRTNLYNKFEQIKKNKIKKYQELADRIIQEKKEQNKYDDTVPAIVTFGSSYNKEFLEKVHDMESYKFIYKLPCFKEVRKYFHYEKDGNKKVAIIQAAPEPQDILWTNLGQSTYQSVKSKLLTFMVTLVLLCISFFITYGLSSAQLTVNKKNKQNAALSNTIISTLISLVLSVTNILINQILYYLTKYERNPTYIHEQTSLGMKAVFAVLVNSILIPIIVNKFLKSNLYGVDGLAHDVFYLAITNSFLSPVLKIFNVSYYIYRFTRWYYNRPYSRLPLNQSELNAKSQYLEFSIGYEYIYVVNLFLFVCFFVSLQPIIVVFAIMGMFLMFWAEKYHLFNRCKRPTPGNNSINTAMYQLIFLGPLMYTLGSFCWSNFFSDVDNSIDNTPNIVAAIISGVIFILPYKKVIKCIVDEKPEPNMNFQQDRIFLPSEYDRLNPATSASASKNYLAYVENYKKTLAQKSPNQVEQVTYQFGRQNGTGHRFRRNFIPQPWNFYRSSSDVDQMVIGQIFGGNNANSVNPFIIGNSILPQGGQINMTTQNWLTAEQVTYNNTGNNGNPAIGVLNQLKFEDGQTVTFQKQNTEQKQANNPTGDINLNFGNLIRSIGGNNRASISKTPENEIPMNLPINLFGNMLNSNLGQKKSGWQNWEN